MGWLHRKGILGRLVSCTDHWYSCRRHRTAFTVFATMDLRCCCNDDHVTSCWESIRFRCCSCYSHCPSWIPINNVENRPTKTSTVERPERHCSHRNRSSLPLGSGHELPANSATAPLGINSHIGTYGGIRTTLRRWNQSVLSIVSTI